MNEKLSQTYKKKSFWLIKKINEQKISWNKKMNS